MIAGRSTFVFGGCVYRMAVDARHAASLAQLAVLASRSAPALAEIDYRHTSNLPRGRCEWLRGAIEGDATLAISCDADTAFDAVELHDAIKRIRGGTAISIAPVRIGGSSESNITVRHPDGDAPIRLTMPGAVELARDHGEIEHGGFGLVVFHLAWFRDHWREPTPVGVGWERSEDTALCDAVRARGGKLRALPVTTWHMGYGDPVPR